ncbi:MAG: hypothetical protein ABL888_07715, partial [Pirellulaceae bacterium]
VGSSSDRETGYLVFIEAMTGILPTNRRAFPFHLKFGSAEPSPSDSRFPLLAQTPGDLDFQF